MGPSPLPSAVFERFAIERLAGSGGMGSVYRARDRQTGESVALKVLHGASAEGGLRFEREAEVLAELRHPAIVRYVAHGASSTGERYLAMEWLEGESLADRLARQGLTLPETLMLVHRVAEALGVAHARGIVHRDLKPSNLFLVGGAIERVKLLDFGIARKEGAARDLTVTGAMLGTPNYMAPEQARGGRDITPSVDVYSLGCVLFKCLTGRTPFLGDDVLSVLLKVVMEEPPRASDLNDEIPEELDRLVARMLSKAPEERPRDAAEVMEELQELGTLPTGREAPLSLQSPALTTTERRILCMVLARMWHERSDAEATMLVTDSRARDEDLRRMIERHKARLDFVADGTMLITLSGHGTATDLAVRAAHCALAVRTLWPEAPVALVAGRAVLSARTPVSELIDRGVGLLAHAGAEGIRIDEVTAALLGDRFDVTAADGALSLRGERGEHAERADGEARTLLGRPTRCEGREQELVTLEAIYEACIEEPVSRAVLVTAPAGAGKSRLRHELVRRLRARGEPVEIWTGQGDPMSAGAPFSMIASALRPRLGLAKGEPIDVRRAKLNARLAPHFLGAELTRVAEFLGELVGVPFPGDGSVMLRAARQDPVLMADQICRAWEDFLAAELSVQPVVLVLEDLHWGDLPSVQLIDAALRNLADQPLMVLALARSEVRDVFPGLWAQRDVQEIRLGGLSRKAAEKLVRQVLGAGAQPSVVASLVERAAGNAFYLEELIRAVAEGRTDALPETVLAMVQTRLEGLEVEARRILRAASVFGQAFWEGGVSALLGGSDRTAQVGEWLRELVARELVARRGAGRLPGEEEYVFRHALVREAAYAMLTDGDRMLGHRLAGDWLLRVGEHQAVILADHFERGGDAARALGAYTRAAEQALGGNDLEAAIARAERGVLCGASGEALGALRLLQAEAHMWRGDNAEARRDAQEAMQHLPDDSPRWVAAAGETAVASARMGDYERLAIIAADVERLVSSAEISGPQAITAARIAIQLLFAGRIDAADTLLLHLARGASVSAAENPAVAAWIHQARAWRALFQGDPGAYLASCSEADERFTAAGDERSVSIARVNIAYACMLMGAYEQAERALSDARAMSKRMGLSPAVADHNLGLVLANLGRWEEARAAELAALEVFATRADRRMEGGARLYLAIILDLADDLEGAETEARRALDLTTGSAPVRAYVLGTLARIRLRRGAIADAHRYAEEAMALLTSLGGIDEGDAFIRLVHAEVLWAAGSPEAARAAIEAARSRLLERAAKITNDAWRQSFLTKVPENARTLALANSTTPG